MANRSQNLSRWKSASAATGRSSPPPRPGQEARKVILLVAISPLPPSTSDMIGERARQALAAPIGFKLGNPKQAEINRAKAAEQAQALRPHIERCMEAGRTSSSAIAADLNALGIAAPNGGRMQIRRVPRRLGITAPAA